jgi:hypothetical protein
MPINGKEGVRGSSPRVGLPQKPYSQALLHALSKTGAFFAAFRGALPSGRRHGIVGGTEVPEIAYAARAIPHQGP